MKVQKFDVDEMSVFGSVEEIVELLHMTSMSKTAEQARLLDVDDTIDVEVNRES